MTNKYFSWCFITTSLTTLLVAGCPGSSTELGHLAATDGGPQSHDAPAAETQNQGGGAGGGGAGGNSTGSIGGAGGMGTGGGTGANNTGGRAGGAGGSGAGGKNTGGNNLPDAGTLSAATAKSFCSGFYGYMYPAVWTCANLSDGVSSVLPPAWLQSLTAMTCGRILKSVAAGRVLYDPANGAACLSALAAWTPTAADCKAGQSSSGLGPPCGLAFVPQVPLGGACSIITPDTAAIECAGGGYCDEGGVSYSCTGTCLPYLDEGASCPWNGQQCKPGTTCNADMFGSAPGKCVARVGAGQSCEGPGGPECLSPTDCVGGSATVAGVCQLRPTSGPCNYGYECGWGTSCTGPSGNRTCSPAKPNGATCIPGNQECTVESYCTAAGICSDHLGVEGEPCGTILGEYVSCQGGFYCDATSVAVSGTCHTQKAAGATCTGALLECSGYHGHCDSLTSKCVSCDGG
jgi:hypothetical protein